MNRNIGNKNTENEQTKNQKNTNNTAKTITSVKSTRLDTVKNKILKITEESKKHQPFQAQNNLHATIKSNDKIATIEDEELNDAAKALTNPNNKTNPFDLSSESIKYGTNLSKMVNFAKIVGVHGVKGFFTADCYFSNPLEYIMSDKIYFYDKKIKLKIEGTKSGSKGQIALILSNPLINTPEKAKSMIGKFLKCQKQDIPTPQENDQYAVAHLIGMKVYYAGTSNVAGKITDIVEIFGDIMLEVTMQDELSNTSKTEYIAFDDTNVHEINVKDDFIILNKLEYING